MENLFIVLLIVWYAIGFIFVLFFGYTTDKVIALLDVLVSSILAITGPLIILVYVLIHFELFDNIIIYKKRE